MGDRERSAVRGQQNKAGYHRRGSETAARIPEIRADTLNRFPYWDGRSVITFNCPEPMMPEPVFEIVDETPAPK
jgi:hypothetical protein